MILEDVVDRAAIAHDVAFETPLFPQPFLQQVRAGASGHTGNRVVNAHDRTGFALGDGRPERRQIRVHEIVLAHPGIEDVPFRLRAAVHGVVLRRGDNFQILRVFPLHSSDERDSHAPGQIGIFSVGFLAASPTGIPEDIDVRRPVRQSGGPAGKDRELRQGRNRGDVSEHRCTWLALRWR